MGETIPAKNKKPQAKKTNKKPVTKQTKKQKRIEWDAPENEYITTNISQRELAKKYKIAPSTVADYAKKHKWVEKRKKYRSKVRAKSLKKSEEKLSNKVATGYELFTTATTKMLQDMAEMVVSGKHPEYDIEATSLALQRLKSMLPENLLQEQMLNERKIEKLNAEIKSINKQIDLAEKENNAQQITITLDDELEKLAK